MVARDLRSWLLRLQPWRHSFVLAWRLHLGLPAATGLALLAGLLLVQGWLWPALREQQAQLSLRQQRESVALASAHSTSQSAREPLDVKDLPATARRGRDLEQLVTAAGRHGLTLERADYSSGATAADGVTRVEATLPLTGSYGSVRQFVATVLNEMPHSGLESLQIERPNAQSNQVQAMARVVFFYRREAP